MLRLPWYKYNRPDLVWISIAELSQELSIRKGKLRSYHIVNSTTTSKATQNYDQFLEDESDH